MTTRSDAEVDACVAIARRSAACGTLLAPSVAEALADAVTQLRLQNKTLRETVDRVDALHREHHARWASVDAEKSRLRAMMVAVEAKVREAMAECGTSSTTHHRLREIVGWNGSAGMLPSSEPADEFEVNDRLGPIDGG